MAYTSSKVLKKNGKLIDLPYDFGQGKTGFVADLGRTLLINYYGSGELQKIKMEEDFEQYSHNPENMACYFSNESDRNVGIIRIIKGKDEKPFTEQEHNKFKRFCDAQKPTDDGGLGTKKEICETYESDQNKHALSFLAVPIKLRTNKEDIFGVIRIPRTSEGVKFSDDELSLIESITGRLVSAIEIDQATSKLREHLETLSAINSKINSPSGKDEILDEILKVLTDNENLGYEFASIQLVNKEDETIKTVKYRKNPTIVDAVDPHDWILMASHPLHPKPGGIRDIQAHILLEEKKAIVVKGKDETYFKYLDKAIFEKYNHKSLVRAFVPIIAFENNVDTPIGTIEAGYSTKIKDNISEQELEMLNAVANQVAITINNWEQKEKLSKLKDKAMFKGLSSMASAISHRMSNSVGLIKLNSEDIIDAIKQHKFSDNIHLPMVETIQRKSIDALQLPRELSTFLSKIDFINKTKVSLDDLIRYKVVPRAEQLIKDMAFNIIIDYQCTVLPYVFVDEALLTEAFYELLENAIKAMPKGGTIGIQIEFQEKSVLTVITDQGGGVPDEQVEEIFRPGFSLRRGTGHGLWTCKNIIEIIHEGDIRLESTSEQGTCFVVKLGRVMTSQNSTKMRNKFEKPTILIVEDNSDWSAKIESYLKNENLHNVILAENIDEARAKLEFHSFGIAIIDLNLKDNPYEPFENWDGVKLIDEIEKIEIQHRPIVLVITGYLEEIPKRFSNKTNIPGFFFKHNFNKDEFVQIIKANIPSKN